jgi:hypothetical protein
MVAPALRRPRAVRALSAQYDAPHDDDAAQELQDPNGLAEEQDREDDGQEGLDVLVHRRA